MNKRLVRKDFIDLTGKVFGKLLVVEVDHVLQGNKDRIWKCLCECGNVKLARGRNLKDGHTKSCGCIPKERMSELRKKEPGIAARNSAYFRYRAGAKRRGLLFDLSIDEFIVLVSEDCHYCGSTPHNISKSEHNNGDYILNGIDRKDNDKGYTVDNCVPCCKICNRAKNSLSYVEFKNWIEQVTRYNWGGLVDL